MGFFLDALRKLRQLDNPIVRDFTQDAETDMKQIAHDVLEEDADLVSKYLTDPFGRWLDSMGYLEILYGVDNYQKMVIDCYNYSEQNIEDICEQMRIHDGQLGQKMANYHNQSSNVCVLLKNLVECLDAGSSEYDARQPISDRLFWFRTKWIEDMNGEHCRVQDVDSAAELWYRKEYDRINVTEDDVVTYCSDSDSIDLFESYNDYIFDAALDWSKLDLIFVTAGMVIYKGVEMTLDEAIGLITKEGHNEKIVREQLNSIIASVISTQTTATKFMKDHDMAKQVVEGLIKDYLSDENKNSAFKSFVDAMGGITAVKELAQKSPELIDYLFTDYSQGLEILDNIAETSDRSGCAEMRSAIDLLRDDYNSKWKGILHKVQEFSEDTMKELGTKELEDWIEEECGDTSVLLSILDITGLEAKADGYHKLLALRKVESELQAAYEAAITKVNSGEYTEQDISAAKNMFEMLRETTKTIYETYRDMYEDDPSKQIWCNEQIAKLDRIGIHGYNGPMEFEAYS